jgi:hypothetical protein
MPLRKSDKTCFSVIWLSSAASISWRRQVIKWLFNQKSGFGAHSRECVLLHPPRLEPKYTPWQHHTDEFSHCDQTILKTKMRMPWYWEHDVSGQNECGQINLYKFHKKERICCKFIGKGSDAALKMSKATGRWRQCNKLGYLKRSYSPDVCGKCVLNAEK